MHIFCKLQHLHTTNGDFSLAPEHIKQTYSNVTSKALINHLKRRQTPTDYALLRIKIILSRSTII